MINITKIDWEKTNNNILGKLLLMGKRIDYLHYYDIQESSFYDRFGKRKFTIDEIVVFSAIIGISTDELIVYEGDEYFPYDIEEIEQIPFEDTSRKERINELDGYRDSNTRSYNDAEIRNVKEFLLYMPLMNMTALYDIITRLYGDFSDRNNYYLAKQLNDLYDRIPESPMKEAADRYRDTYLRAKGNRDEHLEFSESDKIYFDLLNSSTFESRFGYKLVNKLRVVMELIDEIQDEMTTAAQIPEEAIS